VGWILQCPVAQKTASEVAVYLKKEGKRSVGRERAVVDRITSPFNLPTMVILHVVLKDAGTAFLWPNDETLSFMLILYVFCYTLRSLPCVAGWFCHIVLSLWLLKLRLMISEVLNVVFSVALWSFIVRWMKF